VGDVKYFLRERDGFVISTNPFDLDRETVFDFMTRAKWWTGLTRSSLDRALRNSMCFSLLKDGRQIGLARVITDSVTYAYICDVYIAEERRRKGLGTWLVQCVLEHPDLMHLKRVALITHDAQEFYWKLDFRFVSPHDCVMERLQ
jgi:ribosomal protein S18 acetylase RimI-like enzyme